MCGNSSKPLYSIPADLLEGRFGFHANFVVTALAAGREGNAITRVVADNYYALNSNADYVLGPEWRGEMGHGQ
jgi:hypothetical protein